MRTKLFSVQFVFMLLLVSILKANTTTVDKTLFSNFVCNTPGTPLEANQNFCETTNPTLGQVVLGSQASSVYGDLQWYADAAGTVPLAMSTVLTETTFYVQRSCTGGELGALFAVTISFLPPAVVNLNYAQSSYCQNEVDPSGFTFEFGHTLSATPSGLVFLSIFTGTIDLSASSPGTYQITKTVFGQVGISCEASKTVSVTIEDSGTDASFAYDGINSGIGNANYPQLTYCQSDSNPVMTFDASTTLGGTFSSIPTGLALDANTGAVDFISSAPGNYIIEYTVAGSCGGSGSMEGVNMRIIATANPVFSFTQPNNEFCLLSDVNVFPTQEDPGVSGSFSVVPTNGLNGFSPSNGGFVVTGSVVGEYDITFTVSGSCTGSHTETISIKNERVAVFNYNHGLSGVCVANGATRLPIILPSAGGTYSSSPGGLIVDPSTGAINVQASTPGIYSITYTLPSLPDECDVDPFTIPNILVGNAPPVILDQEFCSTENATLDFLVYEADAFIGWYANATGGSLLLPSTVLQTGTYYAVNRRIDGNCAGESVRVPFQVAVYDAAVSPTLQTSINGGLYETNNTLTATSSESLSVRIPESFGGTVAWTGPNSFTASGKEITLSNSLELVDTGVYSAVITYTVCNVPSITLDFDLTVEAPQNIKVSPQIYLQGALLNTPISGLMRDDLRTQSYIPLTSPYSDGATISASILNNQALDADNIVDWVWLEMRDAADNTSVLASQSALVQRDGDVVDVLGNDEIEFNVTTGSYYVVINHRNHLGIMTKDPISLSNSTTILNFKNNSVLTHGLNAQTSVGLPSGVYGLWTGDISGDGQIQLSGTFSEMNVARIIVLNHPSNIFNSLLYRPNGYFNGDLLLDGEMGLSGTTSDDVYIKDNVFGHPSNLFNSLLFTINAELP